MDASAAQRFPERALPPWKRAVLKVGSSLLSDARGKLTDANASVLARFIAAARDDGRDVVVVSSGAVAAGRAHVAEQANGSLVLRQALAALGQTRMIALWQQLLDAPVAQVLLSHDDLRHRRRYLDARNTLLELLRLRSVPVVNENDTVAVEELRLGDNDNLAALVAALVDADLLLIASDVDGLYSAHPRRDPAAIAIATVETITADVLAWAGEPGTALGTGGMRTKLEAAQKAASAGIATVLFHGAAGQGSELLAAGRFRGTLFPAPRTRLAARKYWLRHAPGASGTIRIDAGAASALRAGKSLLPGGIVGVDGEFARGDLVAICAAGESIGPVARGLTQYSSAEIRRVAGRHTRDIAALLGFSYGDTVVHRDDLVGVDGAP